MSLTLFLRSGIINYTNNNKNAKGKKKMKVKIEYEIDSKRELVFGTIIQNISEIFKKYGIQYKYTCEKNINEIIKKVDKK